MNFIIYYSNDNIVDTITRIFIDACYELIIKLYELKML